MVEDKDISFSIVVPTYNRADYLNELLESLNNQTYDKFEVLICDDGSTDHTLQVVEKYQTKLDIKYFYNENSGGPAAPRNLGIKKSRFNWLCFLDSDDKWESNKLEVLVKYIGNSSYDIYCHLVTLIDQNNKELGTIGNYRKGIGLNDFESLAYNGSQIVNSSICINKSILNIDLLYNIKHEFRGIEDYIFLLNLTYKGTRIKTINQKLGFYRIHQTNLSNDKQIELNKHMLFFSNHPFQGVDYEKLNSLFKYIHISSSDLEKRIRLRGFLNLILGNSTLELKIKSFLKMILLAFTNRL